MGGNKYSSLVTLREERDAKYTTRQPKFEGILTKQMVDYELTHNVNNVGANQYASADEVAKVVSENLRTDYNNDGFKASGNTVRLGGSVVKVNKSSDGVWTARKIK